MCFNSSFQVMPSHIARGYKIPRNGTALFQSYGMDDAVSREYTVFRGNINEIVFHNGWNLQHKPTCSWFTDCCEGGNEGRLHWPVCDEDSLKNQ